MNKELFFIWIYFFCGASGALWMIRLSEIMFGKIFHLLKKTIEIDNIALKSIKDENENLENENIKLKEKCEELENKRIQLEDIFFERIIGEGAR